ncbi:MAG: molecular chaperone HtpG [Anaerovibrio sp.]|uniref:Chaperone protein HtpG n=4 Tax=Anaerovibrio slackiae TaxID=2652309 RepID=A0A6I2UDB7_9FIRM|nr:MULTISPECIES: molecular chaperone HtpG [Anaerovibrio]MBQ2010758.1 molecular chaperone HtpG [Selenomonadaceae bacterium]MBQ5651962.1 molecular chaperone HtpG [Selenomonadaceae bacterium]MBQ5732009.1 molecular chaperone HtpG [Selenomonadaceae bacterium]MBQ5846347.1 molecular chaperone HtpG [Selenomonadaceae bacterium]MBQ5921433.1 molecular chaperone HtpG [Selenomonadaceae bacterium]
MAKTTHEFQAETKELLNLMIHSIYTNHEIFLRELISNASDAIDKLHFESLQNRDILEGNEDYEIFLVPDKESHTLTISDNGIGMTKDEVVENIGTIAKSGTKAFLEQLQKAKENNAELTDKEMIGQFGVGFYSAFMVAEKVTITTRKAGTSEAVRWESTGDGSYTLEDCEKESRGTTITITLGKEFYGDEAEENFTDTWNLQNLVKKYSDYVRYPIKMNFETEEMPRDDEGKIIEGAEKIKKIELKTLNSMQPLWTKSKNDITKEEYTEFIKNQFHEWEEPMEVFHNKAEGGVEYTSLLYIPAKAPFNLYHTDYEPGVQLYSRHVFIMDKCKDLLPDYLRFVKGLVDSPDLSLNISRELLQQSRELKTIGKNLEKTILKALERMLKNDREKYEKFWQEFGKSLKIGIYNSMYTGSNVIDKLKELLLFASSKEGKEVSLKEYVERMPESQKKIYYATGTDKATIEKLPQMELLKEKGLEVLYLLDPVDEFAIETIRTYSDKEFQSISRGDLDLDDAESQEAKKETEEIAKNNDDLVKDIKEVLGDKVAEVKISSRLKSGAVCLVADAMGPSLSMEHTFAAMDNPMFKAKRILEINPKHDLFSKLQILHANGKDDADFKDYCDLLYTQALIIEGIMPENPVDFANKIAKMMAK